uniref:Proline rich salivary secreted peptide n=1 Tax=Anopheles farauti TaxID=69004 RepID=A0A182QG68_9DIPT
MKIKKSVVIISLVILSTLFSYSLGLKKSNRDQSVEDELFPIYECDERSREWTVRCLVPLTNAQLSVDLCKTGKKTEQDVLKKCAKELQILGQSCPQPGPVVEIAKDMQFHKPPPPPMRYDSPNKPKDPKLGNNEKDKYSL